MGDYRDEVEDAIARLETAARTGDMHRELPREFIDALAMGLRIAWTEYVDARRRGHA